MPYAPSTFGSWSTRTTNDDSVPGPFRNQHAHLSPFKREKGHRESDAPLVDGVVRIQCAVYRPKNLAECSIGVNAAAERPRHANQRFCRPRKAWRITFDVHLV